MSFYKSRVYILPISDFFVWYWHTNCKKRCTAKYNVPWVEVQLLHASRCRLRRLRFCSTIYSRLCNGSPRVGIVLLVADGYFIWISPDTFHCVLRIDQSTAGRCERSRYVWRQPNLVLVPAQRLETLGRHQNKVVVSSLISSLRTSTFFVLVTVFCLS